MWNKVEHNFGEAKYSTEECAEFQYLGNLELKQINFSASCGCTKLIWDENRKVVHACLSMNTIGEKASFITVNYPDNSGQGLLKLSATIK